MGNRFYIFIDKVAKAIVDLGYPLDSFVDEGHYLVYRWDNFLFMAHWNGMLTIGGNKAHMIPSICAELKVEEHHSVNYVVTKILELI
jgi:hypothetical protein